MKLPRTPQKTTPSFAFSIAKRALLNGIVARRFASPEKKKVIKFFNGSRTCVFCGDRPIKRWDHLVAISKGGDTVLGNMVPACARCDDSKQDSPFEEWALGNANYSPKTRGVPDIEDRLAKIREYVKEYPYDAQSPEDRLTEDEFLTFQNLEKERQELHRKFDAFIEAYEIRVGGV